MSKLKTFLEDTKRRIAPPRCKIGLALGAGAARGMAHLGVLLAFKKAGLSIDYLVGTSFGAFVGAIYACTGDAELAKDKIVAFSKSRQFRRGKFDFIRDAARNEPGILNTLSCLVRKGIMYSSTLTSEGFISSEAMAHNLAYCIPDFRIENTLIPFGAIAADIRTGEEVLMTSGPIRPAVHASCAIAGVFPPVRIGDRILVDGGCLDKIPVLPAIKMGADFIIGVDVSGEFPPEIPKTGADLLLRTNQIEGQAFKKMQLHFADYVITPKVGQIHWADFRQPERLVKLGFVAAQKAIPEIQKMLALSHGKVSQQMWHKKNLAKPFLGDDSIRLFEIPPQTVLTESAKEEAQVSPPPENGAILAS